MGANIAIWPYVAMREGQIIEGGRPGFLNLIGDSSPQEMGLTGITVAKFYETLGRYGVFVERKEPSEYTANQLTQYKRGIEKAINGNSGYPKPTGIDLSVLKFALERVKSIQKSKGGFFGGGFWDTLVGLSGVQQPGQGTGGGTTNTNVQCADGSFVANASLCPTPKKKNNLPLILGISAGVLVVGGLVTFAIIKNRSHK